MTAGKLKLPVMSVLVTGAASGIGRRTAELIARDARFSGAGLFLTDRDAAGLKQCKASLQGSPGTVASMVCDVTETGIADRIVDKMTATFGGIDAVVSNAGGVRKGPLCELSEVDFDLSMALNLKSTWLIAKAAYPYLRRRGGAIVATSSLAATHPAAGLGAYSAAKAALNMLIRQMAVEWGPDGIRCNTVSPGPTLTGITHDIYSDADKRAQREAATPMGRIGDPEDIANAILFLIDPASRQVSGIDILVDGGLAAAAVTASGIGTGAIRQF